jgi:hypothetical protein
MNIQNNQIICLFIHVHNCESCKVTPLLLILASWLMMSCDVRNFQKCWRLGENDKSVFIPEPLTDAFDSLSVILLYVRPHSSAETCW